MSLTLQNNLIFGDKNTTIQNWDFTNFDLRLPTVFKI